jgi:hypothetical protein
LKIEIADGSVYEAEIIVELFVVIEFLFFLRGERGLG